MSSGNLLPLHFTTISEYLLPSRTPSIRKMRDQRLCRSSGTGTRKTRSFGSTTLNRITERFRKYLKRLTFGGFIQSAVCSLCIFPTWHIRPSTFQICSCPSREKNTVKFSRNLDRCIPKSKFQRILHWLETETRNSEVYKHQPAFRHSCHQLSDDRSIA